MLGVLLLGGCVARLGLRSAERPTTSGAFLVTDGTRLPYREWLPEGQPKAIVLALHGMNDSRDAWEYPAPAFTAAGVALYSPDLRGFGATETRGHWPGSARLMADTRQEVAQLHRRWPHTRLIIMAESMGAAMLMVLATQPDPPPVDGYVLIAPAVWGRAEMNLLLRASLWIVDHVAPAWSLTGGGLVKVTASDNREALMRLSTDPLTIHATRVDAVKGLVDLMDQALAAARRLRAPAMLLYGGHDELIPPKATAATWRSLPPGPVRAFYPNGYHLLLRDKDREMPIDDILSWISDPEAPLPSGADKSAEAWLEHQPEQ